MPSIIISICNSFQKKQNDLQIECSDLNAFVITWIRTQGNWVMRKKVKLLYQDNTITAQINNNVLMFYSNYNKQNITVPYLYKNTWKGYN